MAIGSIVMGVVALLLMVGGFLASPVPYLGSILSFAAPLFALVGIVLAGIAMSRAKQQGEQSGAAVAGLVVNIVGFILGIAVALTCGLCNACMSTSMNNPRVGGTSGFGQIGAELQRVSLGLNLAGIQSSCMSDPSGAAAAQFFHPQVAAQFQGQACTLTPMAAEAYGRGCSPSAPSTVGACSQASMLGGLDASKATALGIPPSDCYSFTSGQAKIIGCNDGGGFKIIHWENVNAVQ